MMPIVENVDSHRRVSTSTLSSAPIQSPYAVRSIVTPRQNVPIRTRAAARARQVGIGSIGMAVQRKAVQRVSNSTQTTTGVTKRVVKHGTGRGNPPAWWATIGKTGKLKSYMSTSRLTSADVETLATLLELKPEEIGFTPNAVPHTHPISAALRDIGETMVCKIIGNKRIMDVGGSFMRHRIRKRKHVHCCLLASRPSWQEQIDVWLGTLAKQHIIMEKQCSSTDTVTYCDGGIAHCKFQADVMMAVDSIYYVGEHRICSIAAGRDVYALYHYYPVTGSYCGGEHEAVVTNNNVSVMINGNAQAYTHQQIDPKAFNPALVKIGYEKKILRSWGNFHAVKYYQRPNHPTDNVKASRTRKPWALDVGKVQSALAIQPSLAQAVVPEEADVRPPGLRSSGKPYNLTNADFVDFKIIRGDQEYNVVVILPVVHVLASYILGKIRTNELVADMTRKFDEIARQYNITSDTYLNNKLSSIEVANYFNAANEIRAATCVSVVENWGAWFRRISLTLCGVCRRRMRTYVAEDVSELIRTIQIDHKIDITLIQNIAESRFSPLFPFQALNLVQSS